MKPIGFVYLLGNPWMPDLYKIGCTERAPHIRAAQLSEPTGVPAPFEVLCYIEVEDFQRVEREMHARFDWARVYNGREFFHVDDLALIVGLFRWYPSFFAFTDCGAGGKLAEETMSTHSCPDPWAQGWAPPEETPDFPDEFPWERPALKVVEGGGSA